MIAEEFNWFECPDYVSTLFNILKKKERLTEIKSEHGFGAWWKQRSELKGLEETLAAFSKMLRSEKLLAQLLSSHYMRRSLNPLIMEHIDLKTV